MISCPTCNAHLEERTSSCTQCGQVICLGCLKPVDANDTLCPFCDDLLLTYCAGCKREVSRSATFCPECGHSLRKQGPIMVPEYTRIRKGTDDEEEGQFTGACPSCARELYIEDGFCSECGQSLCTACGGGVDDDDETCPACGVKLFFSCPLCDFELMAGTEMCPNCNALFPSACGHCGAQLRATDQRCQSCRRLLTIQRRQSARTIRTFLVGQQLVRMVACPECGRHLNPATGPCSSCGAKVCAECQLILISEETTCPRCGQAARERTP